MVVYEAPWEVLIADDEETLIKMYFEEGSDRDPVDYTVTHDYVTVDLHAAPFIDGFKKASESH